MPHIHEAIDLTVAAYVVHEDRVLFVHHKKLHKWLPPGGHVELDQDPEQALYAELAEETGLTKDVLIVYGTKPQIQSPGTTFLYAPTFLDIHDISPTHRHIGMTYIVKSTTDTIVLSKREHHDIRWLNTQDIESTQYAILPAVKYYAHEALKRVRTEGCDF